MGARRDPDAGDKGRGVPKAVSETSPSLLTRSAVLQGPGTGHAQVPSLASSSRPRFIPA